MREPDLFEEAQVELGKLIGFISGKGEEEGSPDPWWISGNDCIVFEDFVDTISASTLNVKKPRQASSHLDWMKSNVQQSTGCNYIPTLVTPAKNIRSAAIPHVENLSYWELSNFITWAELAMDFTGNPPRKRLHLSVEFSYDDLRNFYMKISRFTDSQIMQI